LSDIASLYYQILLVYGITWAILHINSGGEQSKIGPDDADKFQHVVWIGLSLGIVFFIDISHFYKRGGCFWHQQCKRYSAENTSY
jgi:hypothetical protein